MGFILLLLAIVLCLWSKKDIHIFINNRYNTFFDYFFKVFTVLGDGIFVAAVAVAFIFISVRKAFFIGLSGVFAGIIAQFFKKIVFPSVLRPKAYFKDIYELHFIQGVNVHSYNSFPSGHTTSAFALFIVLAYLAPKKWMKIVALVAALLVAYSRMYLSQHFLIDVYFGSIFGIISGLLGIYLMSKPQNYWIDKSIQKIIFK